MAVCAANLRRGRASYQGTAATTRKSAANTRFARPQLANFAANEGAGIAAPGRATAAKGTFAALPGVFAAATLIFAASVEIVAAIPEMAMAVPLVLAALPAGIAAIPTGRAVLPAGIAALPAGGAAPVQLFAAPATYFAAGEKGSSSTAWQKSLTGARASRATLCVAKIGVPIDFGRLGREGRQVPGGSSARCGLHA
jgi:hypothetical protein